MFKMSIQAQQFRNGNCCIQCKWMKWIYMVLTYEISGLCSVTGERLDFLSGVFWRPLQPKLNSCSLFSFFPLSLAMKRRDRAEPQPVKHIFCDDDFSQSDADKWQQSLHLSGDISHFLKYCILFRNKEERKKKRNPFSRSTWRGRDIIFTPAPHNS